MDTLEAIFTRRSIRAFTDRPIPDELLRQVLEAGRASASGSNLQAWAFILVRSPERLKGLRSLAPGIIGKPTAVITICVDRTRMAAAGGSMSEQLVWLDIGLAIQNLLLATHSLDLGACPVGSFHQQGVACFLDLPAEIEPVLLAALGYPAVKPASPGRRPLGDVCFSEQWGVPYSEQ